MDDYEDGLKHLERFVKNQPNAKGHEPNTPVMVCEFSRTNWWVFTGGADHSICKWDLVVGNRKHAQWAAGHDQWVRALAAHPRDEHVLVSSGSDGYISLWDTRSGLKPEGQIQHWNHDDWIMDLKWYDEESGSSKIYSCGWDSRLVMYDWRMPDKPAVTLADDTKRLNCMTILDNGKTVITGGNDARVRKFLGDKKHNDQEVKSSMDHIGVVTCLSKHPTEDYIVSGGQDKTIRIWSPNLGRLKKIPAHDAAVTSLAFGEYGYYMFSSSEDCTIKSWDVKNGFKEAEAVQHLASGKPQRINDIAVRGKYVASVGNDGSLTLWEIPYDALTR